MKINLTVINDFLARIGHGDTKAEHLSEESQVKVMEVAADYDAMKEARDKAISERDTAIKEKEAAEAKVKQLEADLKTESEMNAGGQAKVAELEKTISTKDEEIKQLKADVAAKDKQISELPGAEDTKVTKESDEEIPGKKKESKANKYETSADRELAAMKEKMNFDL